MMKYQLNNVSSNNFHCRLQRRRTFPTTNSVTFLLARSFRSSRSSVLSLTIEGNLLQRRPLAKISEFAQNNKLHGFYIGRRYRPLHNKQTWRTSTDLNGRWHSKWPTIWRARAGNMPFGARGKTAVWRALCIASLRSGNRRPWQV